MKIYFCSVLLLFSIITPLLDKKNAMKKIEKNGMVIHWKMNETTIDFEVFAPTGGWLAIGLNETEALSGNNLIMANVKNNICTISDQYIIGIGKHQEVEVLGGINHLSNLEGIENAKGTTVKFSLLISPKDKYHKKLKEGESYALLLAYSAEDNFDHHSRMRTSINIIL